MRKLINNFFFQLVDVRIFALIRISIGTLMFFWLIAGFPNWYRDIASDGMLSIGTYGHEFPGYFKWYSIIDIFEDDFPAYFWWWLTLIINLSFIVGYKSKTSSFLLLVLHTSILHRNLWVCNAEQTIFQMMCFTCLFMPIGQSYSFDAKNCKTKGQAEIWSLRMLQLHCCLIYSISTYWKLTQDPAWLNGETMYYILNNPTDSKFPWPTLTLYPGISEIMTYSSLILEGSFSFLIWIPTLRKYLAFTLIFFHILIAITLNHVAFFTLSMSCALISFLKFEDFNILINSKFRTHLD